MSEAVSPTQIVAGEIEATKLGVTVTVVEVVALQPATVETVTV